MTTPDPLPLPVRKRRSPLPTQLTSHTADGDLAQRQAEVFYLQKQIQMQTPMRVVLNDGRPVDGVIEWYDRNSIKLRGRQRMLIYKSAIRYMHKLTENDPGS